MINDFNTTLTNGMQKFNIALTDTQTEQFQIYCNLLIEWNKKFNLTAITDPEEIALKHFVDSCTILRYVKIPENADIIDVGTGAGFPGIPLKIVRPDIRLTLLDSLNKRLLFLNEVARQLNMTLETVHGRAEDVGQKTVYREKFAVAVSRAVAPLNVLSEYCLPLVRKGGKFIAMKGKNVQPEVVQSRKAIKLLGGTYNNIVEFHIEENQRSIVIIDKTTATPSVYPRHNSKITKKPL